MLVNEKVAIEHGLKADEYKKICELLKRTPNLTELGIFSAMWNEHCSYKSSRLHLKKALLRYPKIGLLTEVEHLLFSRGSTRHFIFGLTGTLQGIHKIVACLQNLM